MAKKFKYELPSYQQELSHEDLLQLTQLAEGQSEHPLAQAIVKHVKSQNKTFNSDFVLKEFKNINGEGISAKIEVFKMMNGENTRTGEFRVCCGNDKLMERFNVNLDTNNFRENMQALESSGKTVVCLAVNNIPRVLISLEEKHLSKEEAKPVLDYMRTKMGLKVAMITGDNKHTALRVAKYLNIPEENVTYRAYPNDKKKVVMKLQAQGERVMFVGDGVNDSPVLA